MLGQTACVYACIRKVPDCIKILIEKAPKFLEMEPTPLLCVITKCLDLDLKIAQLLIDAKTDINKRSGYFERTYLQFACEEGNNQAVKMLLEAKGDPNEEDILGKTCLFQAVDYGNGETLRLLIEAKADVKHKNHEGESPLDIALADKNEEFVKVLIDAKANLQSKEMMSAGAIETI